MLESFDKMIINPHPKHSTRLLKCFETAELSSDRASPFRSAAGLRLYLSCDMVKCQWATRHLAQSMSRPTEKAWIELRHLVQYVLGCMLYHGQHLLATQCKSKLSGLDCFVFS